MKRVKLYLLLSLLSLTTACAESVWAPDDAVAKAAYVHDAPPSITLITVINNNTGEGGHSALMINGSQRVIFDPAGNWHSRYAPERNDFVYGITPGVLDLYNGFHARTAWHVVVQTKIVSPEVAELALMSSKNNGAVASAFCANAVTHVLRGVPGFESIPASFFPKKAMKAFARLPNVTTEKIFEYD